MDTSGMATICGSTFLNNQTIGGANGETGMGSSYAVGWVVLFDFSDTSTVTLNGGSVVIDNVPDNVFQFYQPRLFSYFVPENCCGGANGRIWTVPTTETGA